MIRIFGLALAFGAAALALGSCAGTPKFQPSEPIERTRSLNESLLLCDEYRLPVPATRPMALKPYLDCLDEVAQRFPSARLSENFHAFRDEFHRHYDRIEEDLWTPEQGVAYEIAVHAILRSLWRGEEFTGEFTPAERENVVRVFPRMARKLEASQWKVSTQASFDPNLEWLRAGITSLMSPRDELAALSAEPLPPGEQVTTPDLCGRYDRLKTQADALESLRLEEVALARIAPRSPERSAARESYYRRLETANGELESLRKTPINPSKCVALGPGGGRPRS